MAEGRRRSAGFTLIELLVVMVILGVLAGIAIPVFLHQRAKAADTATRSDLVSVAKNVVAAFVKDGTAPAVAIVGGRYQVAGEEIGPVSDGVAVAGADPAVVDVTGWTEQAWCMAFTNPSGAVGAFRYSAQAGLEPGACGSPTAP